MIGNSFHKHFTFFAQYLAPVSFEQHSQEKDKEV